MFVLAGVVAGFLALIVPLPIDDNALSGRLRVLLLVGLPLLALRIASPLGCTAIFVRVGLREVKLMFVFAVLNIIITLAIGATVKLFRSTTGNASLADATELGGAYLANFFTKAAVQLLGEELIPILTFLALLAFYKNRVGMGRNASVIAAWLISAVAFGLIHLPTNDWNLIQCVVVIRSARVVLTWACIWSKNLWVSTGAHIINDWALIATTVFLAPLATST